MVKVGDFFLTILLTSSVMAVHLIYKYSPPVERPPVLCGQIWFGTSINCNNVIRSLGNGSVCPTDTNFFSCLFILSAIFLHLAFKTVRVFRPYGLRLFGVTLTGFFITVALAILLGNYSFSAYTQSLPSIDCRKPNPFLQELPVEASNNMGFNRVATFPCMYSLLTYSMTAAGFGVWMIQKKVTGATGADLWFLLWLLGCILLSIGFVNYLDLQATALDILCGYALGGIMSWLFTVKITHLIYPYPDIRTGLQRRATG